MGQRKTLAASEGQHHDAALNQLYLRARTYSPSLGRFQTMDTWPGIDENPITLNKYLYGNANPVMHWDPSGQFSLLGMMQTVRTNLKNNATAVQVYRVTINEFKCVMIEALIDQTIDMVLTEVTGGLYIFDSHPKRASGEPYVGRSNDMRRRFGEHIRLKRLQNLKGVLAVFKFDGNLEQTRALEQFFMDGLRERDGKVDNRIQAVSDNPRKPQGKKVRKLVDKFKWCKK